MTSCQFVVLRRLGVCVVLLWVSLFAQVSVAAEFSNGVTHLTQNEMVAKLSSSDAVLIDIRTDEEYNAGYIPGATHLPLATIGENPAVLNQFAGKDVIFYCHSGARVRALTDYLQKADHPSQDQLFHLKGDMRAWSARRRPIAVP